MIQQTSLCFGLREHTWGRSFRLPDDPRLCFCQGESGESSVHYHRRHDNTVTVLSGTLTIRTHTRTDTTHILEPGQTLTVPVGILHQLSMDSSCLFVERYHPITPYAPDPWNDITRLAK